MNLDQYYATVRRLRALEEKKIRDNEILRRFLLQLEIIIWSGESFSYAGIARKIHMDEHLFYDWVVARENIVQLLWKYKKFSRGIFE